MGLKYTVPPWDTEYKMIQRKMWNLACSAVGENEVLPLQFWACNRSLVHSSVEINASICHRIELKLNPPSLLWVRELSYSARRPDGESSSGTISHHAAVFSSQPCAAVLLQETISWHCCSHSKIGALWLLWPWSCLLAGCRLKENTHKMEQKQWNVSRRNKLVVARTGPEKTENKLSSSLPRNAIFTYYLHGPKYTGLCTLDGPRSYVFF